MTEPQRYGRRFEDGYRVLRISPIRLRRFLLTLAFCTLAGVFAAGYVVVHGVESRLQQEAAGQCYRVQYLRWEVDRHLYASRVRDLHVAQLLASLPSYPTHSLGPYFAAAAASSQFLPQTSCVAALRDPLHYRAPRSESFDSLSPSALRRFLASPPIPPR